jgi:ABC-type amino acid transport substrate-binding protein
MNILFNILSRLSTGFILLASASIATAETKSLCVFDMLGANGPYFAEMKDYKTAALAWGVDFTLKPYTNERVAAEDFKAGTCDAVIFTGIRARQFNAFTGSIDAIGSIQDYGLLKSAINTISSKKAEKLMFNDPYEVVGILPAGAAYMFVKDRTVDTVGELAGKRIAILDSDPAQTEMVTFVGASPVSTTIANMYSEFNNGSVDVTYGPAIMYEAMELYKGLEPNGGVIQFSLAQLTLQIVIRKAKFPEGFGQNSRDYALSRFDRLVEVIGNSEKKIPQKFWVNIPENDKTSYNEVFRQARLRLRGKGIYNDKMLTIMRRLRCEKSPQLPECTAADKE